MVTVMLSAERDNVPTTNLDSICSLVTEITSVYLEGSAWGESKRMFLEKLDNMVIELSSLLLMNEVSTFQSNHTL